MDNLTTAELLEKLNQGIYLAFYEDEKYYINLLQAAYDRLEALEQELIDERYRHDRLQDFCVAQGEDFSKLKEKTRWISVDERLPKDEQDVLITTVSNHYLTGKPVYSVSAAFHTSGKLTTEDSCYGWDYGDIDMEYDEETDSYIIPEGWWESCVYNESFAAVDDKVTHWMPLPEPPKEE